MTKTIALLLLMSVSGCHPPPLARICGNSCVPTEGFKIQGQCQPGTWTCAPDGTMTCEGWTGPGPEVCDNVDNDCNGVVDDYVPFRPCSSACGTGSEVCVYGQYVECSAPQPSPEVCDGIDNNCDGIIDNPEEMPFSFCYDAAPETLKYGPCRPGTDRCILGKTVCVGEITPSTEVCDGIDNNCNGQVDEGLSRSSLLDIVVIMDKSPSMDTYLPAVEQAVVQFTAQNADAGIQVSMALVMAPDSDPGLGSQVILRQNLSPGNEADFLAAFRAQMTSSVGTGMEPTLDAVWAACSPSNPLNLNYIQGRKRLVIVLSDEMPQSYNVQNFEPHSSVSISETIAACNAVQTPVWSYTNLGDALAAQDWSQIAVGTSAQVKNIAAPTLRDDFLGLLQQVTCSP